MKTQFKPIFGILCGGALLAGASLAQEGNRPPPGGPDGRGNPAEMLKRADADGDGKVSKEEFIKARSAELEEAFGRIDTNSDGFIDEAEVKAVADRMREGFNRGGGEMRRPDGGGRPEGEGMRRPDGEGGFRRPPEGERPEGMRRPDGEGGFRRPEGGPPGGERGAFMGDQAFSRMDTNGDGVLSKEEFETGMARMREMLRGVGRGEGPPGAGSRGPEGMRRPEGGEGGFRRPPQQGGEGTGRARPELEGGDAPKKDEA